MSDFEINLNNITLDSLNAAVAGYSTAYNMSFAVQQSGNTYQLVSGTDETQDVYCSGTLREVAYFWEGFITGGLSGLPDGEDDGI